jgi:hypothetical protein
MWVIRANRHWSFVDGKRDRIDFGGAQIHSSHGFYATAFALQNVKQWPNPARISRGQFRVGW